MKKTIKLVAVFATASLAFGFAPAATAATATKACLALDTGGVDDKSFNASAWAGAQAAAKKNSSITTPQPLGAASSADYAPNIKKLVDANCDIIVGVGFAINDAIVAAAKANPTVKFAIVDQNGLSDGKPLANLKPLEFATNESSFQAGYLAAGVSKTGKVATFGGLPFPSVTIFMDGFAKGVAHYNKIKGKNVQVLGWDIKTQEGTMVGGFGDQAKALQISKNFEQQGADIILPVAGGLGAATASNSIASKKSYTIWVDTDGFVSANAYRKVLLTSVMKRVDLAVQNVILDVANNKFSSKGYMGTFANQGTKLAPYHDLIRVVPASLRAEVIKLGTDIKNGKVSVK